MEWVVVSLISEDILLPKDGCRFFEWLVEKLNDFYDKSKSKIHFSTDCSKILYFDSDWKSVKAGFRGILQEYPRCGFVFGVLPFSNCEQYKWTKYFARNLGYGSQCVLIENVVSNFVATGIDLESIVKHMAEGILKNMEMVEDDKLREKMAKIEMSDDERLNNEGDSSNIVQLSRDDSIPARTARFLSDILSLPAVNSDGNVRFLTSECSHRVQQLIYERKRLSKSLEKSRQFCSQCQTMLALGSNCSLKNSASYRKKRLMSKKLEKLDKKRLKCENWHETKVEKRLRKRLHEVQNQKIIRCKVCSHANKIPLQGMITRQLKKQHHVESSKIETPKSKTPTPLVKDTKKKAKKVTNAGLFIPGKGTAVTPCRPLPMSPLDLLKSQLKPKMTTPSAASTPRSSLASFLSSLGPKLSEHSSRLKISKVSRNDFSGVGLSQAEFLLQSLTNADNSILNSGVSNINSNSCNRKPNCSSLLTDRIIYAAAAQEANSLVKAVNATTAAQAAAAAATVAANASNVVAANNQNSLVSVVSDSEPPSPAVSVITISSSSEDENSQSAILNPKTYVSHQQNRPSNISKLVNTTGMMIANDSSKLNNFYQAGAADFANVKSENVQNNNNKAVTSGGYGNSTANRRAQQYAVVRPIQIKRELTEDDESTNNSGLDLSIASSVSDVGDFALHLNTGAAFLPPNFTDAVSVVDGAYNNVNLAGLATNFRSIC